MAKESLRCCVSGSFDKYKPEIDRAIEELEDHGIQVIQPKKGWLYKPSVIEKSTSFRPLPNEVGMSPEQVENMFLRAVMDSDFLYVVSVGGYVGRMASFEIGFALGLDLPVFSNEKISILLDDGVQFSSLSPNEVSWLDHVKNVVVASIPQAVEEMKNSTFGAQG